MIGKRGLIHQHAASMLGNNSLEVAADRLSPKLEHLPDIPVASGKVDASRAEQIWQTLEADPALKAILLDPVAGELPLYQGNIENPLGHVRLPLGLAGPLRVNGLAAQGDYPIPLATTEAALVASYHRGCRLLTSIGGCSSLILYESVNRSPGFVFHTTADACRFITWVVDQFDAFHEIVGTTTSHGKLCDIGCAVEGNHVYLNLEFTTGDASGQNMVTLASDAICHYIVGKSPIKPVRHYVESNLSGDKKASARAFMSSRGKKVTAEAIIPADILHKHLHATP